MLPNLKLARSVLASTEGLAGSDAGFWQKTALLAAKAGDHAAWKVAVQHTIQIATKTDKAEDWFFAAEAARLFDDPLGREAILSGVEAAVSADTKQYANASSPGAMLLRMGRSAEALAKLKLAHEANGDSPNNHITEMYYALALARAGQIAEAERVLASREAWAKDNLVAQTWDYQMEIGMLFDEARALVRRP
jgi:hypothetical protein